jgi:hypothetical protein
VTVAKIMARILSKYAVSSCLQVIHSADARSFDEGQTRLVIVILAPLTPMNHSNNDGQLSAESGEGRLLIKENVRQPDTPSTQSEIGGCLRERVERLPTRARYTNVRARSENEGSATAG